MYQEFSRIEEIAHNKGYYININGDLYYKDSIRKVKINTSNYYETNIRYNTKLYHLTIHRLQAYQKYGDKIYEAGIEVRHIDGNGLNSKFENIAIGTHSQNMMDIPKENRLKHSINASKYMLKYHNVDEIRKYHNEGHSYKEIMKKFNISSKGTVGYILKKSKKIYQN